MPVDAYDQLSKLTTLEVLSLRNSKNVTNRAIKPCGAMLMLRSLDLGHTDVSDLSSLQGLSRLEELCLDHTDKLYSNKGEAGALEALKIFSSLSSLTVLNLSESPTLWEHRTSLQLQLAPSLYVEPRSRRLLFCEAIMNKDTNTARRMVADGVDINMTLGPWFADLLREYWLKRCNAITTTKNLSTPCFMCTHHAEKHRPTPLALAIMWNAQEIATDLIFMGASLFMQVWFSDVIDYEGKLVVDEDAVERIHAKKGLTIFYLQQLPQVMFDRNVHRLVDGHVENKTSNWKELCKYALHDLDEIIKGNFPRVRQIQAERKEMFRLQKEAEEAKAATKAAHVAKLRAEREAAELEAQRAVERAEKEAKEAEDRKKGLNKENHVDKAMLARRRKKEEADALEKQIAEEKAEEARLAAIIPGDQWAQELWLQEEMEDQLKAEMEAAAFERKKAALADSKKRMEEKCSENIMGECLKMEVKEVVVEAIEEETPVPYKKPGRQPLKMLEAKETPYDWREHGMVAKLCNPTPIIIKAEAGGREKDVHFLGRRSYWNESNAYTLAHRLKVEHEKKELHERRRRTDRLYEMTVQRIAKQKGQKLDLPKRKTIDEKKEFFKERIAYQFHRKFLVRGGDDEDDLEMNEEEEEEDEEEEEEEEEDPNKFSFQDDSTLGSPSVSPSATPGPATSSPGPSVAGSNIVSHEGSLQVTPRGLGDAPKSLVEEDEMSIASAAPAKIDGDNQSGAGDNAEDTGDKAEEMPAQGGEVTSPAPHSEPASP